jgi:glycosyltransferase involved in cell wall biosynthesis
MQYLVSIKKQVNFMKLLYLTPKINSEGGLERVLCLKSNYLVNNYNYDISIVTQNGGNSNPFYPLDSKIKLFDIDLSGNRLQFLFKYINEIKNIIESENPDIIIIVDSIYKAYLVSFIAKNKRIIYECHNSIYVQLSPKKFPFIFNWIPKLDLFFNRFGASKFDEFIVETQDSIEEWKVKKGIVIPNPLWFSTDIKSDLSQKNVIAVGRHAYEKGFDRLLEIWKKIIVNYPDWNLTIYGKSNSDFDLVALAKKLTIENNITFHEPVKNIEEKYLEASIYLMTSRFEGFGMVLIEAMASGLPCIAYDCPCGPRAIIENNSNGFLIEDGNENQFIQTLENLIENENLRIDMGNKAKISVNKYQIEAIMEQWNSILKGKIV